MTDWKLISESVPEAYGNYLCTIEATENGKTWRFATECRYDKTVKWFIIPDTTEYGDDCIMKASDNWTGVWEPFSFSDDERPSIFCRLIAWTEIPTPYTGDGYMGTLEK